MSDLSGMTLPGAVPAGREIALHEPSFETAIAAIVADPDLPADVKSHWPCSLRRLAAFLDRPMTLVPARWSAVRIPASCLKATRLGVTQKTLANHLSNVRAALVWMHKEKRVPARGIRLLPEWEILRDKCPQFPHRARLYSLMRYCSARQIPPGGMDEAVSTLFWSIAAARRRWRRTRRRAVRWRGIGMIWCGGFRLAEPTPLRTALAQGRSLSALGGLSNWLALRDRGLSRKSHPGP